jgi:iron complex outermembrane recepter protein
MQFTHKKALAYLAALSASNFVSNPAVAQDAPAGNNGGEELSEVVVTGYRASLQGALEVKRNSDLVVDAISGGDIGALPDVTIAETLVRLPGVSGSRDRGNQSQAAMRGLGPRLVLGLVNGREVASSEPNRNVRWEIYPSEVVSGVDVYKSQSADLVAGGVAGTIDIKTIRPLNYSGPTLLLRAGPVWYEGGTDFPDYDPYGYRGSGSFTKSIGDNFAFNIGITGQKQKNGYQSFQGWGFNDGVSNPGNATGDLDGDGTPNPTPWGAQTEVKKLEQGRFGANVALGFRVGDTGEINFDAMYSKFTIDEDQNQAWFGRNGTTGNWANGSAGCYNAPASDYTLVGDVVVAATLDNCYASVTNVIAQYTEDKDLFVTGLNASFDIGSWNFAADLSHSNAERVNRWAAFRSEVYPATMTFDMSAGNKPFLTLSEDPSAMGQSSPNWLPGLSDGPDNLQDELSALRLDLTREFEGGAIKSLAFGVRRSERDKDFFRRQQEYISPTNGATLPASLFTSYRIGEFDVPPLLNGNFNEIIDAVYGGMPVNPMAIVQSSIWGVEESVTEAYTKLRFEGSLGSVDFNANAGVRVVQTETTSTGFGSVNGGTLTPLSIDHDYTEVLPSVNFNFNLAEDRKLRVGLGRVIARPPLDELRASRQLWNTTPPATGSGGNPRLDAFVANQLDVSYEWYFKPEALIALAVYYKDVDSHIGYTTEPVTIDGTTYAVTGPFNGEGGGIAGAEFTFQTPFSGALKDFGIYFNYAYADADVKEFYPVQDPLPVAGWAEHNATLDLWYSRSGFEARVGYKYTSPSTTIPGWNGADLRTLAEESLLDFSTSYQVNDSIGLRFQINNLTNERSLTTRDNDTNRLGAYDVYGRRALLDFTFKY